MERDVKGWALWGLIAMKGAAVARETARGGGNAGIPVGRGAADGRDGAGL